MFKPIMAGLFGVVAVNRQLRNLWKEVEALKAELAELKGGAPKETETANVQKPEPQEVETVNIADLDEAAFDWRTCGNQATLKQWALDTLGLSVRGNKKPETIRAEIESFLSIDGE